MFNRRAQFILLQDGEGIQTGGYRFAVYSIIAILSILPIRQKNKGMAIFPKNLRGLLTFWYICADNKGAGLRM
jgi:hypothetical protein